MTTLNLGILDLVPVQAGVSAEQAVQQAAELAVKGEEWGYQRYWTSEHHDLESLGSASPEVLLAHIGARTSRIMLGSGAVLLPHYSPLKVAEWFHLLSALYPGRVELGLGRAPGGKAHASMALSGNFLQHVAEFPQSLRAVMELLEGTYTYEDVPVHATPSPRTPPVPWLLGTNVKSAAYAAEFGTGYVFGHFMSETDGAEAVHQYRGQFQPSSMMEEPRVIVAAALYCARTEAEAKETAARAAASMNADPQGQGPEGYPVSWIVGNAEQAAEQLNVLAGQFKTDELLIVTTPFDHKERLQSYRLLAQTLIGK
ncbi:MsnO8 family LLM class oxidoreductase [Paenibacillus sp. JX-17]|uniref:MsnO8 family LLM class oxidoreductase n=1 Tax=Paenibacillus lacisoli TaxID=3064525 RepID=A0ABT9CHN5_9BACL|nr:MsnO8 family LLM class oxidoreductase [Paenibacillus sp. JX-17]MDO7907181.1 MsnO8 family LLM class oxidoreductase [Paenibacillus sp. JX-17]